MPSNDEHEDDFTPDEPDGKALSQEIDGWLMTDRPERYSAADKEWMDATVEKAAAAIRHQRNEDDVAEDLARHLVYQREGQATRKTNRVLRDIGQTGQLPLGWGEGDDWRSFLVDVLHLPISIDRQRVRFGAATEEDWVKWELESARASDQRSAAEAQSRNGARLLRELLNAQGARTTEDIQPEP